ncbi:MAG: hypothetical protein FJW34_00430 [Acidobacteria bacterium]|nr:hypothetical protein [Acidobacteriota bacterium]
MLRPEPEAPNGRLETELSRLFVNYREALPDPEPTPGFMPGLWRRIDSRRSSTGDLRRLAQGFVTAAALLSLLIGIFLTLPQGRVSAFYSNTYLEILAADADQSQGVPVDLEMVPVEAISYERAQ